MSNFMHLFLLNSINLVMVFEYFKDSHNISKFCDNIFNIINILLSSKKIIINNDYCIYVNIKKYYFYNNNAMF